MDNSLNIKISNDQVQIAGSNKILENKVKKKIVFYYPDMFIGGVEMAILNLAKRIYKDYELFFFYRSISNLEFAQELARYGTPRNIRVTQQPMECDVLVYCSLWLEFEDYLYFLKPKKRVLWCHAMIPPSGNKFYHLPFMRKMDNVILVSNAIKSTVPTGLYTSKITNKICVINNIVNTEEVIKKSLEETPKLNLAKDLNISITARLSHEKGWHRVKLLTDEFIKMGIDFKWFIIGEGYFPEELHRIHALLDRYPQIEFLGRKLNPFPYVKQMDYAALLSDFESWGLTITEGKILGKPIICTDFPAAFEQVENDINGVIIPMNNYRRYKSCAYRIMYNKEIYKTRLEKFNFEKVNQSSLEKWHKIFNGERGENIVF